MTGHEIPLEEYRQLKQEQLERIKLRDSFINLDIVAIGVLGGVLASHPQFSTAWLVVPWICSSFGWAYAMNDEKVSALQRYFRTELSPRLDYSLGWEVFDRRKTSLATPHKISQLAVEFALFVLPTLIAVFAYFSREVTAGLVGTVIAICEIAGAMALAFFLWAHSDLVKKFDVDQT